jgi:chromosome partitioning protein
MNIVSVINQKGGVGKTTTTVNLGAALARLGQQVLLVDLDPQGNLGTHLGLNVAELKPNLYDVLVRDVPLKEAVYEVSEQGIWCVPSNLDLSAAELELVSIVGRETLLADAIDKLEQTSDRIYNTILLDCPPSLGMLTVNALTASERVLVPLQAEFFALQGMARLTEVINLVQRRLNPQVRLSGIVACKVDRRPRLTQEVLDEVKKYFGDRLMKTLIRPNVKLAEAPSYGQSVLTYAPGSNGAIDYMRLAREFLGLPPEEETVEEETVTEAPAQEAPVVPEPREAHAVMNRDHGEPSVVARPASALTAESSEGEAH